MVCFSNINIILHAGGSVAIYLYSTMRANRLLGLNSIIWSTTKAIWQEYDDWLSKKKGAH